MRAGIPLRDLFENEDPTFLIYVRAVLDRIARAHEEARQKGE